MKIPPDSLSPEALQGVLEEFALREGTEYGMRDYTLEEKVAQLREQLRRNKIEIIFDEESRSVTLQTVMAF